VDTAQYYSKLLIDEIFYDVILGSIVDYKELILEEIDKRNSLAFTRLKGLLIGFIIILLLIFFAGWLTYIIKMRNDVRRILNFVTLIPLDIIMKVREFRTFFSEMVFAYVH